jgi:putative flippase GtrA
MRIELSVVYEFSRYALVGGVAFGADLGTLVICREFLLRDVSMGVYVAAAIGFVVGLLVNYSLSLMFVFSGRKYEKKGRTAKAFIVFSVIGALGLLWTELGMWIGVSVLDLKYGIVKVFVAGMVLLWNFLLRKFIVFGELCTPKGVSA